MSTNSKNCPSQKKLTREKSAIPPPPVPLPAKVPCPRDQRAYALHLEGHTQRWIADKLKCTQPTVLRGIRRMEKWLATTLPEDRGEYTATEKLRLAMAKHERLMEAVIKMSLREFRRSRKTIPMKKQITTKDGVDEQGDPVKIRIEEWKKPQIGRKGFIDSAAKASHEITVLAAGWLGPGSGSISMAEVMDPEERDCWDRIVTTQKAQLEKLEERAEEQENRPATPREESAQDPPAPPAAPVSEGAENNPKMYHEIVHEIGATISDDGACEAARDASPPEIDPSQNLYQDPPKLGTDGVALADEPMMNSAIPINLPSAGQPVENVSDHNGGEAPAESALAVKGRITPCGNPTPTRPLPASAIPPGGEEGELRSGVSAGSETRAQQRPPTPTYVSVLGPGGRLIWLKKES